MVYKTKDSGNRQAYDSGMVRDLQDGKPDFYLCIPKGIRYEEQMLTRFAGLMTRGIEKYGYRNWEKANSEEELDRFKASALRHMMQWVCDENDEDHASAVLFNIIAYETTKIKLQLKEDKNG